MKNDKRALEGTESSVERATGHFTLSSLSILAALFAVLLGLAGSPTARADTVTNFAVTGSMSNGVATILIEPGIPIISPGMPSNITFSQITGEGTAIDVVLSNGDTFSFSGTPNFSVSPFASAWQLGLGGDILLFANDQAQSSPFIINSNGIVGVFVELIPSQGGANYTGFANFTPTGVPEPTTWYLLGTGLLSLAGMARRKRFA